MLQKLQFTEEMQQDIIAIAKELVLSENEFAKKSMEELHNKIQLLKRRLSKLYTDRCDGMVDDETYLNMRNQWQLELDKSMVKYEKINNASNDFVENIENLSNLCKSAPDMYLKQTQDEKRNLMNLVMSNPIFDVSKLVFAIHPAFEYVMKLYNGGDEGS